MPRPKLTYEYSNESLVEISDWPADRLYQDQTRGDIDMQRLASVAVWLAANGKPWLRAKMAAKLLPEVLGMVGRRGELYCQIEDRISPELLELLFQKAVKPRKRTAKKRGQRTT